MAKSVMCPGRNYVVKINQGNEYKSPVLICLLGTRGSTSDLSYNGFENLVEKVIDLPNF